jgi:hypothetical protein
MRRMTLPMARARVGNRWAALTLAVLAPVSAELTWGLVPMTMLWFVVLLVPMYGAGILLLREAVVRAGRGWPSILVLGLAYELVEDGFGLQALSSPTLYGAAGWGPRVLGLNLPYWEANVLYHVVFSAVIPILLTDLLFPAHRRAPYLGRTGLVGTAVAAVAGVGLLRVTVPPVMDPGYTAPLPVLAGTGVAVAVLAVLALVVLPRREPGPRTATAVPHRGALAALAALATVVGLGLVFPVAGAAQPAFTRGAGVAVPMLLAALLAAGAVALVRRWARSAAWSDRHALALAGGALVAHSAFGAVNNASTNADRLGLVGLIAVGVTLLVLLDRRLARLSAAGAGIRTSR